MQLRLKTPPAAEEPLGSGSWNAQNNTALQMVLNDLKTEADL